MVRMRVEREDKRERQRNRAWESERGGERGRQTEKERIRVIEIETDRQTARQRT